MEDHHRIHMQKVPHTHYANMEASSMTKGQWTATHKEK